MKALIERVAESMGLKIRARPSWTTNSKCPEPGQGPTLQAPSAWPITDTLPPRDEVLCDERWIYHVLQMANRHFKPEVMQYHRSPYGDDTRLKYIAYFLDVRDQRVLEVGPLEGHHSVLLEKMGVRENIAIEARAENLRKCERIKEKYRLDRTRFFQHDLEKLAQGVANPSFDGPFDLVFCLGVFYHLREPARALEWFRTQTPTLFLGTHYIETVEQCGAGTYCYKGKSYRAVVQNEHGHYDKEIGRWQHGDDAGSLGELSGTDSTSILLYEKDLIDLLHDCGFSRIHVLGKDLQNAAPHITLLAEA